MKTVNAWETDQKNYPALTTGRRKTEQPPGSVSHPTSNILATPWEALSLALQIMLKTC